MLLGRGASSKLSGFFGSTPLPEMQTNHSVFCQQSKLPQVCCCAAAERKTKRKYQGDFAGSGCVHTIVARFTS